MSPTSCSINKLKSHILFTCKSFTKILFSNLTWKNFFLLQDMVGKGGGAGAPPAPPLLSLRPCTETLWIFIERAKNICFSNAQARNFFLTRWRGDRSIIFFGLNNASKICFRLKKYSVQCYEEKRIDS